MKIKMWRTTKRDNSTATPTSQPSMFTNEVEYTVTLKEPTDVLNPTFILAISGHDGQNYVSAFGRYYWVTGVRSLANQTHAIDCRIDPLGSYRGHIQNTSAYVLYDSTPNTEIPDNRLGVKTTATYSTNEANMPWGFNSSNGTKFVAIEGDGDLVTAGKADSATGVYKVTDSIINKIGNPLDWNTFWSQVASAYGTTPLIWQYKNNRTWDDLVSYMDGVAVTDFVTGIVGGVALFINMILLLFQVMFEVIRGFIIGGDALKHVKSAYWLPFSDLGSFTPTGGRIAVGSYVDTLTGAQRVDNPIKSENISISIPWQFSDWRNVQNTEIQIFIPLIGVVNIPSSAVKGHNSITIMCGINIYSGTFAVKIRCGETVLGTFGANCMSPILIGDSNPNAPAITNSIVSAGAMAVGAVTGTAALTAGAIGAGIQNGLGSIQPISTSVGGIGGGIGNSLGHQIWCTTICHDTSDTPSNLLPIIGTPTDKYKQLNGSGFCQTLQAHMSMTAVTGESYPTESEVQQVNNALNSGVYLE